MPRTNPLEDQTPNSASVTQSEGCPSCCRRLAEGQQIPPLRSGARRVSLSRPWQRARAPRQGQGALEESMHEQWRGIRGRWKDKD